MTETLMTFAYLACHMCAAGGTDQHGRRHGPRKLGWARCSVLRDDVAMISDIPTMLPLHTGLAPRR